RGSCMMARPVVDLPQPDSPTSPRVSPSSTSRLTPDTAWTLSPVLPTGNSTTTSVARRRGSASVRRCAVPLPAIGVLVLGGGVGGGAVVRGGGRELDGHLGGRAGRGAAPGGVVGQCLLALGGADGEPAAVLVAGRARGHERWLVGQAVVLGVAAAGGEV